MPQLHCAPSQAWHQDWKSVELMTCHQTETLQGPHLPELVAACCRCNMYLKLLRKCQSHIGNSSHLTPAPKRGNRGRLYVCNSDWQADDDNIAGACLSTSNWYVPPLVLRRQRLCDACESGPLLCAASIFCHFLTQSYAA